MNFVYYDSWNLCVSNAVQAEGREGRYGTERGIVREGRGGDGRRVEWRMSVGDVGGGREEEGSRKKEKGGVEEGRRGKERKTAEGRPHPSSSPPLPPVLPSRLSSPPSHSHLFLTSSSPFFDLRRNAGRED